MPGQTRGQESLDRPKAGGVSKALGTIASPDGVLPGVVFAASGQVYVVWGRNATEKHVVVSGLVNSGWITLGPSVDDPNAEYDSGPTEVFTPEYRGASRPEHRADLG
jgi:hypothetical protein